MHCGDYKDCFSIDVRFGIYGLTFVSVINYLRMKQRLPLLVATAAQVLTSVNSVSQRQTVAQNGHIHLTYEAYHHQSTLQLPL